jgi:RNA polymerase sigma factor (sigma-70 family)
MPVPPADAPAWNALFSEVQRHPQDADRWSALYAALWPYLSDWVIARYGLDAAAAADVVQDALLEYRAKLTAGRVDRPSVAHVRAFVRLSALTALRARSRLLPLDDILETGTADPEESLVRRLAVDQAMDRLEPRCAYVLRARYHQGQSSAEIARTLRTDAGNVDVILHRCRARLREILE